MREEDLPAGLTVGDRNEDARRGRVTAVRQAEARAQHDAAIARSLADIPDVLDEGSSHTMSTISAYWELIPEIEAPSGRGTFQSVKAATLALSHAFPVLDEANWLSTRALLAIALCGRTDVVSIERFDEMLDHVREAQRSRPNISPEVKEEAPVRTQEALASPRRWLVIILTTLVVSLVGVSLLYLKGGTTFLQAQIDGTNTRVDAIDARVDRIDNRTADIVTAFLAGEGEIQLLTTQKESLEVTLASLRGELGDAVRTRVEEERRKDVDLKIEIRRLQDQLTALQSELGRLRQEQEPRKEN